MAVADAPREVYMFLFVASLVHYIFGMGLFWHRRDKHPVRGHSLTLVTSLGTWLAVRSMFIGALRTDMAITCSMFIFLQYGPGLSVVAGYLIRSFRIYHFYTVAAEKAKRDNLKGSPSMPCSNAATKLYGKNLAPPIISAAAATTASVPCTLSQSESTPSDCGATETSKNNGKRAAAPTLSLADIHQRVPSASNVFKAPPIPSLDEDLKPKRRWAWSDKRFTLLYVTLTVLSFALEVSVFAIGGGSFSERHEFDGSCTTLEGPGSAHSFFLFLCVILMCVAVWKLRRVYDAYRIKSELALVAMWSVVSLVFGVTTGAVQTEYTYSFFWIYVVIDNLNLFHTVTWKALVSYDGVVHATKRLERSWKNLLVSPFAVARGHRRTRSGSKLNLMTTRDFALYFNLDRCLEDPEAAAAFEESLKREWAIENILFYRTVALFADSFDDPTVTPHDHAHMARAIFEEFIERGASSQVNISAECYDKLIARMEACMPSYVAQVHSQEVRHQSRASFDSSAEAYDIPSDLFAGAAYSIYVLMETDSFVRFKNSSLFRQISDGIRRRHSDPQYVKSNIHSRADTLTLTSKSRSTRVGDNTYTKSGCSATSSSARGGGSGRKPSLAPLATHTMTSSTRPAMLPECKSVNIEVSSSSSSATATSASACRTSSSSSSRVEPLASDLRHLQGNSDQSSSAVIPIGQPSSLTEAELAI